MALSGRKKKWADLKIQSYGSLSNAEAAVAAGYSADSASKHSYRFAADPCIIEYINEKTGGKANLILIKNQRSKKTPVPKIEPIEPIAEKPNPTLTDPMAFLLAVMAGQIDPTKEQLEAARTLMAYKHPKKGEVGKKEQMNLFAEEVTANNQVFSVFKKRQA